jgi:hypothetical protein
MRKHNGRRRKEFFIKWKGYPAEDNTWEPLKNLNPAAKTLALEMEKNT